MRRRSIAPIVALGWALCALPACSAKSPSTAGTEPGDGQAASLGDGGVAETVDATGDAEEASQDAAPDTGLDAYVDARMDAASAPQADGGSSAPDASACVDACKATPGVTLGCETRFLFGVNYAWKNWVADFGGIAAWNQPGVSQNQSAIASDLTAMRQQGVDVIRWWMLQELEGDSVQFDSTGTASGVGGTLLADIDAALSLAATAGVHYNFTLFSFDDFAPDGTNSGLTVHGMAPIVTDQNKLAALMNVVATVAQAVESSPNRDRVVAWDVINEPEWAITGTDPYGDPAFDPNTMYQSVDFAQMEAFVRATVATLHAHSSAPVTVGGAAIKWAKAWSNVGLDYYTFHMYDWVNQYYPYDHSLASYGVTDKPAVMGEFPLAGLAAVNGNPAVPLGSMLGTLFTNGYAGAMPWAFDDTCCGSFSSAGPSLASFASAHSCVARF